MYIYIDIDIYRYRRPVTSMGRDRIWPEGGREGGRGWGEVRGT